MISAAILRRFLFPLLVFAACATLDPGGSGTETTTGIIGAFVNDQGVPQADVRVLLLPEGYDPVSDAIALPADTTDSLGRYTFKNIHAGRYTLLAVHLIDGTRTLISGIFTAGDTVKLPVRTLLIPGSVKVSLLAGMNSSTGYLFVPGTTLFTFIGNRTDFAVLDSVPAGNIPEIAYTPMPTTAATAIRYNVPVSSGDTTDVVNPSWKYARTLILNTSVSGANVTGTVVDFPALIRLSAGNFDFAQTREDGADIRFTKGDQTPLPYEIERWDPVAGLAELWVRCDTVLGNDASQVIIMYWGNTAAADSSNSTAVFDTAAGFQGVWHFSDDAGGPVGDATGNGYHGVSPDAAWPRIGEGAAGNCRVFNGITDYITMPNTADSKLNFPEDGYHTVSAWVNIDTLDGMQHLIVAKGYEQYFLRFTYFPSNSPLWEFSEFNQNKSWQVCTSTATSRQWTLLTGVRQGNRQLLYCNGVLVDSTGIIYPNDNFSRNTSNDLSIGKFLKTVNVPNFDEDSYCFFKGSIDEVRIIGAAQGPDWVKLCYMNQRTDDRLVEFK
jgi:hypothetical protein